MAEIFSVFVYLFILLFPFIFFATSRRVWVERKFLFYFLAYLPAAFFASVRGNVGTDTENYKLAYETFEATSIPDFSVDYLYTLLVYVAKTINLDFHGFSFIHAGLCLFLYAAGTAKLDKVAPIVGLGILPVLFVDATFNGLRYGLAFAVATVFYAFYLSAKSSLRIALFIVPALVHSSLGLLFLVAPRLLLVVSLPMVFLGSDSLLYFVFLSNKADSYSDFSRPGLFSGLMPVFNFIMLCVILRVSKIKILKFSEMGGAAIVVFFAGLAISQFSYAGLRILQLGVFFMSMHAAVSISNEYRLIATKLAMLIGILGVLNFLRQIFIVGPAGDVIFHPYGFFW